MPATTSPLMALRFSGRLMVIQNACPRFSSITLSVMPAPSEKSVGASLLHAPSLEKPGIGGVLLDVGGIALLGQILDIFVPLRGVLVDLGVIAGALGAAIAGRD